MTTKQESKLSMYMTVRDLLKEDAVILKSLPDFEMYETMLIDSISNIQLIREDQELCKTGIAVNKSRLKNILITKAIEISRKMVIYAELQENNILKEEINYTLTDFSRCADTILKDRCQIILERANENIAPLTSFSINNERIIEFEKALNEFNEFIPKTRLGITEKKEATSKITDLFEKADEALHKLDLIVELLADTQVYFYKRYKNTRKVVYSGTRKIAVKGIALDKTAELPVKNVTFKFLQLTPEAKEALESSEYFEEESVFELSKKTTTNGMFYIKNIKEGTYNVTVSKLGYKEQNIKVSFINGETTKLKVLMEKV